MKRLALLVVFCLMAASCFSQTTDTDHPAILTGWCGIGSPVGGPTAPLSTLLGNLGNAAIVSPCWGNNSATNGGSNGGVPMPSAGTLKHLNVIATYTDSGSNPGTVSWPVQTTVFVNNVASTLTCSVTLVGAAGGSANQAVKFTCSDTTDEVTVSAGDEITAQMSTPPQSFSYCNSGDPSCPSLMMSVSLERK